MNVPTDTPSYIEVYEEHWDVFDVFLAMDSQWRKDQGVPYALDLTPLPGILDILDIDKDKRKKILYELRIIEHSAIHELTKQRK